MKNLLLATLLSVLLNLISFGTCMARTRELISVGALRFTSSGPLFLAKERGYFADEGLDVEIVFFESAPNIAVATASGEVTFGVTALTAAFYNLAADGTPEDRRRASAREEGLRRKRHPGIAT